MLSKVGGMKILIYEGEIYKETHDLLYLALNLTCAYFFKVFVFYIK